MSGTGHPIHEHRPRPREVVDALERERCALCVVLLRTGEIGNADKFKAVLTLRTFS